jgi:hypothetical protein
MKQQTAVEWLIKEFNLEEFKATIQFAKAMEKEQIEMAYQADRSPCSDEDAEQYYKETYKN